MSQQKYRLSKYEAQKKQSVIEANGSEMKNECKPSVNMHTKYMKSTQIIYSFTLCSAILCYPASAAYGHAFRFDVRMWALSHPSSIEALSGYLSFPFAVPRKTSIHITVDLVESLHQSVCMWKFS